jgi:hypothetical protein
LQYFYSMTKEDKNLAPYEVFQGSAWEASLLKSILEDNDIETIIQQASSLPWNIMPTEAADMKVFVALENLEQAKAIVTEFYTNMEKEDSDDPQG